MCVRTLPRSPKRVSILTDSSEGGIMDNGEYTKRIISEPIEVNEEILVDTQENSPQEVEETVDA
jgi:hypothetical protein